MLNKLGSPILGRRIQMDRGVDWMNRVNPILRRGSIVKIIPWGTKIRFETKTLKEGVEVDILMRGLAVLHVESNCW